MFNDELVYLVIIGSTILLTIGLIFLVAVLFRYAKQREKYVWKKVREWADSEGYTNEYRLTPELNELFKGTELRPAIHVTRAEIGVQIVEDGYEMIGYKWIWMNNNRQLIDQFFIMMAPFDFKKGGTLKLRPYNALAKRPGIFIQKDELNFESVEFSRRFNVFAFPEKFGYDFFTPRMCQFFLKNPRYKLFIFRGNIVLAQRFMETEAARVGIFSKKVPEIDWMKKARDDMKKLLGLLPSYIGSQTGTRDIDEEEEPAARELTLECPECSHSFHIKWSEGFVKCPECGVEGEI